MRQKLVAGNWKMNPSRADARRLLLELREYLPASLSEQCLVLPPALYVPMAAEILAGSSIRWGAQNVWTTDSGAFTGEHAAVMFRDFGCTHILVGHSERRRLFHESEKNVAEKFHHVKERGMIPVLCVGETLEERDKGLAEQVLARQIESVAAYGSESFSGCIVAYEPVWAIGTGKTASPAEAQAAHALIRRVVESCNARDAAALTIVYGGSVTANNAAALFSMPDVDGGLVGGASLDVHQFVEIVKCIN